MHQIVIGALVRDRQVLLALRSPSKHSNPGVWDLPGGHVEADESELAALARELHEELGVQIALASVSPLARVNAGPTDDPAIIRAGWSATGRELRPTWRLTNTTKSRGSTSTTCRLSRTHQYKRLWSRHSSLPTPDPTPTIAASHPRSGAPLARQRTGERHSECRATHDGDPARPRLPCRRLTPCPSWSGGNDAQHQHRHGQREGDQRHRHALGVAHAQVTDDGPHEVEDKSRCGSDAKSRPPEAGDDADRAGDLQTGKDGQGCHRDTDSAMDGRDDLLIAAQLHQGRVQGDQGKQAGDDNEGDEHRFLLRGFDVVTASRDEGPTCPRRGDGWAMMRLLAEPRADLREHLGAEELDAHGGRVVLAEAEEVQSDFLGQVDRLEGIPDGLRGGGVAAIGGPRVLPNV